MIKKYIVFLFVFILSISLFTTMSSAQPLTFDFPVLEVTDDLNGLASTGCRITNNNETSPVNIYVEYYGENDAYFSSNFSIEQGGYYDFDAYFVIEKDEIGCLYYNIEGYNASFPQPVIITVKKTNSTLDIFPDNPVAGSNVAFLITNGNMLNAYGFLLYVDTGKKHPINIDGNGWGTIKIDENETGIAVIRIVGEGIDPLIRSFTIQPKPNDGSGDPADPTNPVTNPIVIGAPETVVFGETKEVTITQGNKPLAYESMLVTSPSGQSNTWLTNSFGKYQITFNVVGIWSVSVLGDSGIITKSIACVKEATVIYLQTSNPLVNNEVEINAFDGATIKVEGPDGYMENGMTMGAKFKFTPEKPGSHTVTAESANKQGTITFDVKTRPRIILTDIRGNPVSFNIQTGKTLYVRLVDSNNELLEMDTTITIKQTQLPFSVGQEISLIDSYGVWMPTEAGSYTVSFSGSGSYDQTETNIQIVAATDDGFSFDINIWFMLLISVIIAIIILVLKKAPLEYWKSKYTIWRQGKKSGNKPSKKANEPQ